MKFGKRLKCQMEETLPEWRDKYLSYKPLKKLLRSMPRAGGLEPHFLRLLNAELDKLNAFFVEQEEDFVIRRTELQERIQRPGRSPEETPGIQRDVVNLHGEMVLLENYSSVNYTGLAKILKKYDKRTGRLLRLPFIEKVLKQPFFTTDLISKLVKDCENMMEAIFPQGGRVQERREEEQGVATNEQSIFRSTVAALTTMREIRRGSSTYSHFSLPPLTLPDQDMIQSLQPPPISIQ